MRSLAECLPWSPGEVHAAALLGSAHMAVVSEQWDEAESVLGRALAAAEGAFNLAAVRRVVT